MVRLVRLGWKQEIRPNMVKILPKMIHVHVGRGENSSECALGHSGRGDRSRLGWVSNNSKRENR